MTRKIVLTRLEIERTMLWMRLNKDYQRVMFLQKAHGMGQSVWARFYNPDTSDHYEEIEVTDYDSW